MFKINRKIEYAVIALKHMYEKYPGELTSVREVCRIYGSPFDVTSRVMQVMAHGGILKSEHGPLGGYLIMTDLNRISLLELAEMILGPVKVVNCLMDDDDPHCDMTATCNIIAPITALTEKIKEFYASLSLRELIAPTPTCGGQSLATKGEGVFTV